MYLAFIGSFRVHLCLHCTAWQTVLSNASEITHCWLNPVNVYFLLSWLRNSRKLKFFSNWRQKYDSSKLQRYRVWIGHNRVWKCKVLLNDPGISCLEPSSVSTITNYLVLVENIIGHSCTSWIGPGNPETKYRNDKIADANRNLSYIIYRLYSYGSITPIFFKAFTYIGKSLIVSWNPDLYYSCYCAITMCFFNSFVVILY